MKLALSRALTRVVCAFTSKKGENYVDTGLKILIAVVLGALLLAGLYLLFNGTIMFSSRY